MTVMFAAVVRTGYLSYLGHKRHRMNKPVRNVLECFILVSFVDLFQCVSVESDFAYANLVSVETRQDILLPLT
jgi:hypothetical protein